MKNDSELYEFLSDLDRSRYVINGSADGYGAAKITIRGIELLERI